MKIATKLGVAFTGIGAAMLLLVVLSLAPLERGISEIGEFHAPALTQLQDLNVHMNGASREILDYVVSTAPAELFEYREDVARVEEGIAGFRAIAHLEDEGEEVEAALFREVVAAWEQFQTTSERLIGRVSDSQPVTPELIIEFEDVVDEMRDRTTKLKEFEQDEVRAKQTLATKTLTTAERSLFIIGGISVIGALLVAILVSRTITRPIRHLEKAATDAARGHATRVEVTGSDELSVLGHAFNEMLTQIESGRSSLESAVAARTRELEDANEAMRQLNVAVENAMTGISLLDSEGRFVMVREGYAEMLGYRPDELIGCPWTVTVPSEHHAVGVATYEEMLRNGQAEVETYGIRKDGSVFDKQLLLVKSVDDHGMHDGHYCFMRDISDRKHDEAYRQLMMHELDHRVKNTLASVLSLSVQTSASVETPTEFAEKLNGRIMSMARTHEALAAAHWTGTVVEELILLTLAAYRARDGAVNLSGPYVRLTSRASGPVCLALHELTTNAAKHGSLSRAHGSIDIDWQLMESSGLRLRWREHGGPRVKSPLSPGLGTTLIRGLIERELKGTVELEYEPNGLHATIHLPPECIAETELPTRATPTSESALGGVVI